MAYDKVVDSTLLDAGMTATADAIRAKTGQTAPILWKNEKGFATEIANIQTGVDTSDATATESDIAYEETAYVNGEKKVGTMHRKEYNGEIVSTVLGNGFYAVLAKDALLAEHRNDETLFVRVEFDTAPTAFTIIKNWATNVPYEVVPLNSNTLQQTYRLDASAKRSLGTVSVPVNTDSPESVGCLQITADGELRCYSNSSSNYAIRPGKYKVVVEW